MAERDIDPEYQRFSRSLDELRQQRKHQAYKDIQNLQDERGRNTYRWGSVGVAALFLVAFVVVVSVDQYTRLIWAPVLLIPPVAIALEAASTRQYHRYRAALQAMIDGRIQQQRDAAKAAAAAAKKAEREAAQKKAEEEAKKREVAKKTPPDGGNESGSGADQSQDEGPDSGDQNSAQTSRTLARAIEMLGEAKLLGIINTNDPRFKKFNVARDEPEEPEESVNDDERLRQKAQEAWQIPYERDKSES